MTVMSRTKKLSSALRMVAASSLAVVGLGLMEPAQAHDELLSTTPEQNSKVESAPDNIELTYSGALTEVEGATQVRVTDSEGKDVTSGEPKVKGKTVTQKVSGHGDENETYTVTWRVVSSDGHPIQGTYEVTVGEGQKAVATSESTESASANEASNEKKNEEIAATDESNGVLKIGIFVAAALVVIGAIIALIAKTRKTQR